MNSKQDTRRAKLETIIAAITAYRAAHGLARAFGADIQCRAGVELNGGSPDRPASLREHAARVSVKWYEAREAARRNVARRAMKAAAK